MNHAARRRRGLDRLAAGVSRPAAVLGLALAASTGLACIQFDHLRRALRKAARRAAPPRRFEHRPAVQRARVLVLGDSTGVGIGAADPRDSLAGLLAAEFPNAEIVNASMAGARLADVLRYCRQAHWPAQGFDVVLLHVGGNDVLRMTGWKSLAADAAELLERLRGVSKRTIWMGVANIGLSPLFIAPFSWWLSVRTQKAARLFAACAEEAGAEFISFYRDRRHDVFSRDCDRYYSADGLHPSSHSYRYCYEVLKRRSRLTAALESAVERRRRPRLASP
jgi:lysophospholipase L1-like esterase